VEFTTDITLVGWALLIGGSLVFRVIVQFVGRTETGWEWLVGAIAAFVGAVFASELVTAWTTIEPIWEGVALLPALVGGLVVGILVDLGTRFVTGGSPFHRPMAA
jgi:uncharacterized membrane protein YeaQ/YmgE (transglycosylase-associated protein family)